MALSRSLEPQPNWLNSLMGYARAAPAAEGRGRGGMLVAVAHIGVRGSHRSGSQESS